MRIPDFSQIPFTAVGSPDPAPGEPWLSPEGIAVKPFYEPKDLEGLTHLESLNLQYVDKVTNDGVAHLARLTSHISPDIHPLVRRANHRRATQQIERLLKLGQI